MKKKLPKLAALTLLVAFVTMGVGAVLPHHHDAQSVQHACWVCKAKAAGAGEPVLSAQAAPQPAIVSSTPAEGYRFTARPALWVQGARAPPFASL